MELKKIFVVIDPTTEAQPALERAIDSAHDTGARLHLYACATEDSGYSNLDEARKKLQPTLESLVKHAQGRGSEASFELEWGQDWARQAATAAARDNASMIFKNSVDHSSVQRELRTTSDWTLLRHAPCPVLMVKNFTDWRHRRILAAINPASTEKVHISLNQQITALAGQFADSHGSEAHFITAYHDLNHAPDGEQIALDCGVTADRVHLAKGKAADVISETAIKLEVDLIIVGTVARDGIKGRVVGNTCERLLDQTHSDLLVLNK